MTMKPEDCARFNTCSAPVCPLDPVWRRAVHRNGEPVCYYLRNTGKARAAERFADDPVYHVVLPMVAEVAERFPIIRGAVERAARSGFLGAHLIDRNAQ
jgi:hypothetical protein